MAFTLTGSGHRLLLLLEPCNQNLQMACQQHAKPAGADDICQVKVTLQQRPGARTVQVIMMHSRRLEQHWKICKAINVRSLTEGITVKLCAFNGVSNHIAWTLTQHRVQFVMTQVCLQNHVCKTKGSQHDLAGTPWQTMQLEAGRHIHSEGSQ